MKTRLFSATTLAALLLAGPAFATPTSADETPIQAPRIQEVQAPRGDDVQAPRGQHEQASHREDIQAP